MVDKAGAVFVPSEDLGGHSLPPSWLKGATTLVVTQGHRGALMHCRQGGFTIPPYPVNEVDPTGAGDVFAAAYLVRYSETRDPLVAGLFASCAASFKVEVRGEEGAPTRTQVEARMKAFPDRRVQPADPL